MAIAAPTAAPVAFDLRIPAVATFQKDVCAVFCKAKDEHGALGNMANGMPIYAFGLRWGSSEALYQALRFPHLPEFQEQIRHAPTAWAAKDLAYTRKKETRPDWEQMNLLAMAFALTCKLQSERFQLALANAGGRQIVELSMRDRFWGAEPRGAVLIGRNVLGFLLTQLAAGARVFEADLPVGFFRLAA
ncbi:NADAR family protein [Sphingosinicella sp. BN140058]|uniref:NADAR family protein n=1 Tax=Sphingosinicella sp. BN140058 TaxID=1892855 RepID=UPI0013EAB706|nr:NADAR family protein [Sphingosinicella sp. BN140058]